MWNSEGREAASNLPISNLFVELYHSKRAAFDGALEEAVQRGLASGNVEKLEALLLHLDQMTREYRDL